MISPVTLGLYLSSAVAAKIAVIARGGFKAVPVLIAGYPKFRSRHPSKAGKCLGLGFATGCAVTVSDAPNLGRKFTGYVATETAT